MSESPTALTLPPDSPHAAHNRFVRWTVGIALSLLLGSAAWNVAADPFGLYGWERPGIYQWAERESKQTWVRRWPHDAMYVGSSRFGMIDPGALRGAVWFNAGISNAVPEELDEFLRLHLRPEMPVVLGLDFYMFNETAIPPRPSIRLTWEDYLFRYPLHLESLRLSWFAVRRALIGREPLILANGQTNPWFFHRNEEGAVDFDYTRELAAFRDYRYARFAFSEMRVERLRALRDWLEERGVRYVVVLNPENAVLQREVVDADPFLRETFERYQREMRMLFPGLIDLSKSRYAAKKGYFYEDPQHYLPATGARFMNEVVIPRLFEQEP